MKTRELSDNERVVIKFLREAGHSHSEIAKRVGCTKSTAHRVFKIWKKQGSLKKHKNFLKKAR